MFHYMKGENSKKDFLYPAEPADDFSQLSVGVRRMQARELIFYLEIFAAADEHEFAFLGFNGGNVFPGRYHADGGDFQQAFKRSWQRAKPVFEFTAQ